MKTIDEAAKECAGHVNTIPNIKIFKKGVEFAQRWIPVEEELPKIGIAVILKRTAYSTYATISRFNKLLLEEFQPGLYRYGSFYFTEWRPIELK